MIKCGFKTKHLQINDFFTVKENIGMMYVVLTEVQKLENNLYKKNIAVYSPTKEDVFCVSKTIDDEYYILYAVMQNKHYMISANILLPHLRELL